MKRVPAVALGYQGFGNVGDEAILAGIERLLGGTAVDVVAVIGGDRAPIVAFPAARRVTSARLLPTLAAIGSLRRARLLLVSGGGLIHDHWAIVIPRYLAWSILARVLGTRVCWIGVGVGPIRRGWARRLAALTARLAQVLTVRDEASAAWLRRVGVPGRIELIPDPAFFLPARPHAGGAGLAFIVRPPVPSQAALEHRLAEALAGLAARRAPGANVTLLTMEHAHDAAYADAIADAMARATGTRPPIRRLPLEPTAATTEIANFDAVVSLRLHGMILCALAATPCLPIIYDEKVAGTATRLGLGDDAVPLAEIDAERLDVGLDRVGRQAARETVEAALVELRGQAPRMAALIGAVADG